MKERPIIFGAESVRAILEGRKTQTRRVCKAVPCQWAGHVEEAEPGAWWFAALNDPTAQCYEIRCPFGAPGDRLWVREAWARLLPDSECEGPADALYRATADDDEEALTAWVTPIFMPRWASRLTLEVVAVRVERLQEISTDDIDAEGIECEGDPDDAESYFRAGWDHLNGKRAPWATNPWVWVVAFTGVAR